MASTKYRYQIEPQLSKIYDDGDIGYLGARREARIFVVCGLPFSGKTLTCNLLQSGYKVWTVVGNTADLFRKVARATRLSAYSDELPTIVVDDFASDADVLALQRYYLSPLVLIETVAPIEQRLGRALSLAPGKWNLSRLRNVDEQQRDRIDSLSRQMAKLQRHKPWRVSTARGRAALVRTLEPLVERRDEGEIQHGYR
jgi:hypothetical protein